MAALNGETYELNPSNLVIADDSGAIALAGVIGGAASAISAVHQAHRLGKRKLPCGQCAQRRPRL